MYQISVKKSGAATEIAGNGTVLEISPTDQWVPISLVEPDICDVRQPLSHEPNGFGVPA
jgi:hypothetical protein